MKVGVAVRPKAGETVSGDTYVVLEDGLGLLVAVIDGLGHGPRAAEAAGLAREYIEKHQTESLEQILRICHEALRATHGAAISLAHIDPAAQSLISAGVGNVAIRIDGENPGHLLAIPGIIGHSLPRIRTQSRPFHDGDILVLSSDGVSERMSIDPALTQLDPAEIAEHLLANFGKSSDDATVVVVR
ncbi:MAG: SpoIIE family protein phosphatase [Chloroflexi bacterium]|nr:SpoIIE family protein phosphatase [Chloroflexota bacterium]